LYYEQRHANKNAEVKAAIDDEKQKQKLEKVFKEVDAQVKIIKPVFFRATAGLPDGIFLKPKSQFG
jgi:hypothetical protein